MACKFPPRGSHKRAPTALQRLGYKGRGCLRADVTFPCSACHERGWAVPASEGAWPNVCRQCGGVGRVSLASIARACGVPRVVAAELWRGVEVKRARPRLVEQALTLLRWVTR